jgi:hypothetical protein
MFICNFINRDIDQLDFLQDCSESEKIAVQKYIDVLRLQLLDEIGD